MSFEAYNPTVMDHFLNPRNTGEVAGASHQASFRNPVCGDLVKLTALVKDGVICEVRTKTFGCAAAIAASSALTVLLNGLPVTETQAIRNSDVVAHLGGLPEGKENCSVFVEELIRQAFSGKGEPAP